MEIKIKSPYIQRDQMEIGNSTLFFVGIALLIVGGLIVVFDYPQIRFFDSLDEKSYHMLDAEDRSIHQRLVTEFAIGVIVLSIGIGMAGMSFLGRFQNGIR